MKAVDYHTEIDGFTLVELSIVLVIIGLIVGGVLVGRDLIKAAEIRAVYSDKEKITIAVNSFKSKYNCLAGDCPNSEDFFGKDGGGADCTIYGDVTQIPPPSTTCNGNGDGKISTYYSEFYYFWQQLQAAGFIVKNFNYSQDCCYDSTSSGGPASLPEISSHNSNFWFVGARTIVSAFNYGISIGNSNYMYSQPYSQLMDTESIFTPTEMLSFDTKFDDGKPDSGTIQTLLGDNTCNTPTPNATYITTTTTKTCGIIIPNIF